MTAGSPGKRAERPDAGAAILGAACPARSPRHDERMECLSVRQPWAELIASGAWDRRRKACEDARGDLLIMGLKHLRGRPRRERFGC